MLKSFITGAVALGLAFAATPNAAKASDAVVGGVLIGAILGGTVAAIAESNHRHGYRAPRQSYGYQGHGYRRPVVVERRVYRSPPPRVVYRGHYRTGYHGRPARGHGRHYR